MKARDFKQGDWVFCEFKLQRIKELREGGASTVSDGFVEMGGHDIDCYPLNMKIKVISDNVSAWSRELHALRNNSLNYPDIHRELLRRWVEMCDNADNEKKLDKMYDDLADFVNEIKRRVRNLATESVGDIRIFR